MPSGERYRTGKGIQVLLGQQLGVGGEGAVFEVTGRPDVVAKVYHTAVDAVKAAKLLAMTQAQSADLLRVAAWPTVCFAESATMRLLA